MKRYSIIFILLFAGYALAASIATTPVVPSLPSTARIPIGVPGGNTAYTTTQAQILEPFTNYTGKQAKRGKNFAFNNLSANKLTVKEIIMPVPDEGNSMEMYQPIVHGGNSVTFKPYSTMTETVILHFTHDGIYKNYTAVPYLRKVVSW